MKKQLAALLSASMLAGSLAAVAMPAIAMAEDGEVEEITWMFWDDPDASTDNITLGFKDVVDRFNADYEGKYHCTIIATDLEPYYNLLNARIDSPDPDDDPDVFIVSPGPNLTAYVEPGIAAPLDEYLEADGWKDTFASDAVFAQQTYDGQIYAVPLNTAAACVFYNKEIFEEAGAEVPTTYDELLEACAKIQEAGYTPITISAGTAWCLSMLAGYLCDREGVDLAAIASGEESWVNEKTLAAGEKLIELSQYFDPNAAAITNDQATAALYDEEAAILIQGSWAIGQMNGANPDFEEKCGVFQFPAIEGANDPNRIIAKSDSLAMNVNTKHPEAAIALMKYFTDDIAQKYTAEVGGKIPVTKVEYDAEVAPRQLADVMEIFGNATGTFGFYNESLASTEAGSFFDDQMVAMYLGKMTPEEAFQAIEDFYVENVRGEAGEIETEAE